MPREVKNPDEFIEVAKRAIECRVKLGYRRVETPEGRRKRQVLKVKARTPSYLYTIVFEDIDKGVEFAKKVKEVCKELVILDPELEEKLQA